MRCRTSYVDGPDWQVFFSNALSAVHETGRAGRAASPTELLAMPSQVKEEIVAENASSQALESESASLLDDLRLQLGVQQAAKLNIRWRLTRSAEKK